MWKGRFQKETAELVRQFSESVSYDWRLFRHDILGSIAHARAQHKAGLLSAEEFAAIEQGLQAIGEEIQAGTFVFDSALEDVHMNIEKALTERIGPAGAKLHAARSRNDQVATDTRLYCREHIDAMVPLLGRMQSALLASARRYQNAILPGYTHLQRGQPVLFAHHLLAYIEMFDRDKGRLLDCRRRLNVCPLGSGALAGSTINLDREAIADELGFDSISRNSMDAISDRDYIAELLFALALTGTHLSRLSEDIILWASSEFAFVSLSDAHSTGSSLMPQKKNPDVAELTRGKTGRLYGNLITLLTALKGLPLTYNRDLQEDKEPLFDSLDTIDLALRVNSEMLEAMEVDEQRTRTAAADPLLLATDLADYLVTKGVPFRQAHDLVGKAVAEANATHTPLDKLDLPAISEHFDTDASKVFSLERALNARSNTGSPSPTNIESELSRWENLLQTKNSRA